jgi:hypothetical protein
MRAVVLTVLGLAALGAVSVQAAPIVVPAKRIAVELGAWPSMRLPAVPDVPHRYSNVSKCGSSSS